MSAKRTWVGSGKRTWVGVFSMVAGLLGGCSGGGDPALDKDVVTSLPSGDATGSDADGDYQVQLYTSACSGDCKYTYLGFDVSGCDVGHTDSATLTLTQVDGHLQADVNGSSLLVTRFEGGLWQDGSFDIGGYSTQQAGDIEVTARATGSLSGDTVTGTAKAHAWGSVDGSGVNCTATYDLTGSRQ